MNRRVQSFVFMTIFVLILLTLMGCQALFIPQESDNSANAAVSTDLNQSGQIDEERPQSAVLRLNRSLSNNFNPLLDTSSAGQANQTLIFQSLYTLSDTGERIPVLAEQFSYNQDKFQLTVSIRTNVLFHDQQMLKGSDVLATLNFIKQHPESPFFADLTAFQTGYLTSENTLVLQLSYDDKLFLDALDFPVLKSTEIDLPDGSLLQGTGRYKMDHIDQDGDLWLIWADPLTRSNVSLTTIELKPYSDAQNAMKAMEDDQLDLVYLPKEDLLSYQTRNSLRLDRFATCTYVDILIHPDLLVENSDQTMLTVQSELRAFLQASRWFSGLTAWPGQASEVPVPANHVSLGGKPLILKDFSDDALTTKSSLKLPENRSLVVLANQDNPLSVTMAKQIATWFETDKYMTQLSIVPAAEYFLALKSNAYDVALRETNLSDSANPELFYFDPTYPDQGLMLTGTSGYDKYLQSLAASRPLFGWIGTSQHVDPAEYAKSVEAFRTALSTVAIQSNSIGVMFREAAIAYGDRVDGQVLPAWQQPFTEIEELWIWSGLSPSSY